MQIFENAKNAILKIQILGSPYKWLLNPKTEWNENMHWHLLL